MSEEVEEVVDWGEIEEGFLYRFYAMAGLSEKLFEPHIKEEGAKRVKVNFHYLPANTTEEAVFTVPASWGRDDIDVFLDAVYAIMTIYGRE